MKQHPLLPASCHAPRLWVPLTTLLLAWSLPLIAAQKGKPADLTNNVHPPITKPTAAADYGPFCEPDFPFVQTPVDLGSGAKGAPNNFVVRGILLPLKGDANVVFDQELLRFSALWFSEKGKPPVTLMTMAQTSYHQPHQKNGADHPKPTAAPVLATAMHPGVATSLDALFTDPRAAGQPGEAGRGPLPAESWRFEGIELAPDGGALLRYRCGKAVIAESYLAEAGIVTRQLDVGAHPGSLYFAVGTPGAQPWTLNGPQEAVTPAAGGGNLTVSATGLILTLQRGELVAELAESKAPQHATLQLAIRKTGGDTAAPAASATAKPTAKSGPAPRRWAKSVTTSGTLSSVVENGLILDRLALPVPNPWKRAVRSADVVFQSENRAALLTYDGDVWLVDGVNDPKLATLEWRRFASGLNEPLAMAVSAGVIQIATKNGVVRLHDRDANGEADWYENFCDLAIQSQSTRSFALDMDMGPDGSTYISQGGIAMGGAGSAYTGSVAKISPDGRSITLVSTKAREPYVTVHPKTGRITGTDQQGQFIPSSLCYSIVPGDSFGFGEKTPAKLTKPLVWIPHVEDNSSSSQLWLLGAGMGPLHDQLLHLSYGTGQLFLICPDFEAPEPQGAVVPLLIHTNIPLLQGRMHPGGASAFLTGFQIYDSRTTTDYSLGRLRLAPSGIRTAVGAQSCAQGVILSFASPLKPATVTPQQVTATVWNYKRSAAYGSGRFKPNGDAGSEPIGVGQVVLSADRKSVFIHLPTLQPVMQLEVRHSFEFDDGPSPQPEAVAYFTIHQPRPLDLAKTGFPKVDLTRSVAVIRQASQQTATIELGKTISQSMGCIACHSVDGNQEGKTGPTWKGLFGTDVKMTDGSVESANEFYLRDSILVPQRKIVAGYQPGMASYQGVLTDIQIDSIILYIQSLK